MAVWFDDPTKHGAFFKTTTMLNYPKCSMYGIFTNIYPKNYLEM